MEMNEELFKEIKDFLVSNSKPKYQLSTDPDFFGEIVWDVGGLKYKEYLQVIEDEEGETFSIDENGFSERISPPKLKQVFADFPNSGSDSFIDFFQEQTGYGTWEVDWEECSNLKYGDSSCLMWSGEAGAIDDEDEVAEIIDAYQKIKAKTTLHDNLQDELGSGSVKQGVKKV